MICKGLHCAGCGKGIPLSVIMLVIGIVAICTPAFDAALSRVIETITIIVAAAWILTLLIYAGLVMNLRVVHVRQVEGKLSFCERKFMETGDIEWLSMSDANIKAIEPKRSLPYMTGSADVRTR